MLRMFWRSGWQGLAAAEFSAKVVHSLQCDRYPVKGQPPDQYTEVTSPLAFVILLRCTGYPLPPPFLPAGQINHLHLLFRISGALLYPQPSRLSTTGAAGHTRCLQWTACSWTACCVGTSQQAMVTLLRE
jgi:hypothetical protein